jgi:hypothetical protein
MAKQITIEYFGFTGTGATVKEAKENAGRQILALQNGSWTPVLVTWRGHTALLTRDLNGWTKRFLQHDEAPLAVSQGTESFFSLNDALTSTRNHIVQLGWQLSDPIDLFPEWYTDEAAKREAIQYRQWQLNYRELISRGLADHEAHQLAGQPRKYWPEPVVSA